MQLVERQVIKPNRRFLPEADRLFLVSKKLDNCNNNISGQNFFPGQLTNNRAIDPARSKSVGDKALPTKVRRYVLVCQCQAVRKNDFLKGYASWSGTNI